MLFWYVAGDMADQVPAVIKESEEDFGTAELFKEQEPVKQAAIEPIAPKKADALINARGLDKTFRGPQIERTLQANKAETVVAKPAAKPAAPKAVAAPKAPAPKATQLPVAPTITPAQMSQKATKKPAPALKPVVATAPTQKEAAQAQAKALVVAAQAKAPALKPASARTTLPIVELNEVDRAIIELEKLVGRIAENISNGKDLTVAQRATIEREILRFKNLCRDSKATTQQVAKINEYLETLESIKQNRK